MRLILLACAFLIAAPAFAQQLPTLELPLSQDEAQAIMKLLDEVVKHDGLTGAKIALPIADRLTAAMIKAQRDAIIEASKPPKELPKP